MKGKILLSVITFTTFGQANFVLIGPPGSGKGTFSSLMTQEHGYRQVCLGDILRDHKRKQTTLWKEIEANDCFVTDETACRVIEQELSECLKTQTPFIVDGFPRTSESFAFLSKFFEDNDLAPSINFVHFVIDDKTCTDRITQRLVCPNCASIFNKTTKQPQRDMTCDMCKSTLETREKDTVEETQKRLVAYRRQTEPLLDLARDTYNIVEVDATRPIEECLKQYKDMLQANTE